ncbi:MAG: NADH-quinone oxidoreductase subunit D [Candidatus Omnitrophota bacterium]|nr:NADH-quinone oxidoreductase subunit D [Candidatus Omnitrophota bacterium]
METALKESKCITTEEFLINMGPQHPSTHGVLYLELKLDGEVALGCTVHLGYLHRGMEKIAESRTLTQFIPFTDRLDYIASMNNNLAFVLAAEKLLGLEVNARAKYIRVVIAELNRIASHLLGIGCFAQDLGAFATPLFYCFRDREKIVDIFNELCGNRLTYNYMRIGGVQFDFTKEIEIKIKEFIKYMSNKVNDYEWLLSGNVIFLARTKNVGVLLKEVAINYGVTGPNLRASGVKWDLRKDEPYSGYENFQFDIPTGINGDSWDRYKVKLEEIKESLKIIEQAIGALPEGDPTVKAGRQHKLPVGEAYMRSENPRGELGFYIAGDGSFNPYRLKIRPPSFSNLSVIAELVKGCKIADVVCILGSLDIVMGEIDR